MIKLNAVLFSADMELKSIVGMAKNNIIDMDRIYKTNQDPIGGLLNIELSVMNTIFFSTIKMIILIINLISLFFWHFYILSVQSDQCHNMWNVLAHINKISMGSLQGNSSVFTKETWKSNY